MNETTVRADGLITVEQAAQLCGVETVSVRQWGRRGRLALGKRENGRLLYNLADVVKADAATRRRSRRPVAPMPDWVVEDDPDIDVATLIRACRAIAEAELDTEVRASVVYYVRFADRIKIGTTSAIVARMESIPHDRLLATEPGGRDVEARRHAQFAPYRVTGEWFEPAFPLLAHIAALELAI